MKKFLRITSGAMTLVSLVCACAEGPVWWSLACLAVLAVSGTVYGRTLEEEERHV